MIASLRRSAAQRRLAGLLRRSAADRGIILDQSITIRSTTEELQLTSDYGRTGAVNSDEAIGDEVIAHAARHQAALVHGKAWRAELAQRRIHQDDAPDASRIMHPLALRLLLEEVGRGEGPSSWALGRTGDGRLRDVDWRPGKWGSIIITRILIDIGDPSTRCAFLRLPKHNQPAETEYSVLWRLPDTVAMASAGHRLTDVVAIAPSGEGDVDQAVGSLVIRSAAPTDKSTIFTLEPATWLPVTRDPAWRDWHMAHVYKE